MIIPLFTIIKKDLKIFFRSKISSISIILIPLLIILFAGSAFNSSEISNIQIGVYSDSPESIQKNILEEFRINNFLIQNYTTKEGCIDSIKLSKSQLCVAFETNDRITFHIDNSRINLADLLINNVKTSASKEAKNIGGILVQNLIDTLQRTKDQLPEKKENIDKSIGIAEKNRNYISGLSISDTNINDIEIQLESAIKTVNNSNTKNKINEALDTIEKLKEENRLLEEKLSGATKDQISLISELEKNSKEIDDVIKSLESEQITAAEKIISPFEITVEPITSNAKKRDHLIPILISLITLFGSTLLASTFVMKAKKSKAYFRNFVTPIKSITFILGTYFTCIIILLIQFAIVFLGIYFILKMNIFTMPLELITAILISLTVFIFLGMLIGYLFKSEETIIFSSMIISAILMFFSNTIVPIENISQNLMKIAQLNPLVISHSIFKKIILFQINFIDLKEELIIMGIFAAAFLLLTYIFRHISRRRL